jgi:Tol biopolymer transport system component
VLPRRRALAAGSVLAALAVAPPPAPAATASFVVYRCGDRLSENERDDLCRVGADGRGARRLTRNGGSASGEYEHPSLSRDGRRLAFTRGGRLYAADADATNRLALGPEEVESAWLSPSGGRVAFTIYDSEETYPSLYTVGSDGKGLRRHRSSVLTAAWLGGRLIADIRRPSRSGPICVLSAIAPRCARVLASNRRGRLTEPTVSPGGRRMAVTVRDRGIALYSLRRGRFVRWLTDTSTASGPTWSPDGQAVAYSTGAEIWAASARGPRAVHLLAYGDSPTWGGRAGKRRPHLRLTGVSMRGRRLSVRGRLARAARARLDAGFSGTEYSGYSRSFRPRPHNGRFRMTARIPRSYLYYCAVVATYPGDARFRRATVTARVRGGICRRDPA